METDTRLPRLALNLAVTACALTPWWDPRFEQALAALSWALARATPLTDPRSMRLRDVGGRIEDAFMLTGEAYRDACRDAGDVNLREAALRAAREACAEFVLGDALKLLPDQSGAAA